MEKTFNTRIKLKRDTSANWTSRNPKLLDGELILVDTADGELRAKIGDGEKTYTQLPFTDEVLKGLIGNKADTGHDHTSISGNAGSATKLTTSAGSATQPVYFSDGKPVKTTHTLGASVPADAKFTDHTYDAAGSSLGLVKSGGDVTISDGVITVNDDSHNHTIANVDGLQTALDGKAATSHGTHVEYSTTAPKANGTASVGTATTVSRSDHVHPLQTSVSGNAGTATKLATAYTISLTGDVTGSVAFDGSKDVSITATVVDDSHAHVISNIDGLQSALDGKSASSHTHDDRYYTESEIDTKINALISRIAALEAAVGFAATEADM